MFLWLPEKPPPKKNPQKTDRAREDERRPPSKVDRQIRHREGGYDRADVGSAIENARCQSALALREPVGHGFDRGGKVGRLAEAERESGDAELQRATGQSVRHGCDAPDHDCLHVPKSSPEPINET